MIVEKPFGMDTATGEELSEQLGKLFPEEELYRIDHYLGKELTQVWRDPGVSYLDWDCVQNSLLGYGSH